MCVMHALGYIIKAPMTNLLLTDTRFNLIIKLFRSHEKRVETKTKNNKPQDKLSSP